MFGTAALIEVDEIEAGQKPRHALHLVLRQAQRSEDRADIHAVGAAVQMAACRTERALERSGGGHEMRMMMAGARRRAQRPQAVCGAAVEYAGGDEHGMIRHRALSASRGKHQQAAELRQDLPQLLERAMTVDRIGHGRVVGHRLLT